jgi:hypothetical protein
MMLKMEEMRDQGLLDSIQMLWFTAPAPAEALYDCKEDPFQIHNLANDPRYESKLNQMRLAFQKEWIGKYNRNWVSHKETYFIERARPNGVQPVTVNPEAWITKDGFFTIKNPSKAVTVSYTVGDAKMSIYTKPVKLKKGDEVTCIAGRIGYKNSDRKTIKN